MYILNRCKYIYIINICKVFNKLFSLTKCETEEVVTAFSGLLELSRRNKVITSQEKLFGDISVEKNKDKIA
jgi:chromatin segregation and condensation protein Rec8/ScpA/Scc1 (kleisin family)